MRAIKKGFVWGIAFALLLTSLLPMGAVAMSTVPLPELTADSNNASYASSPDSMVYYYTGVAMTDYESYLTSLLEAGYVKCQDYAADGSVHSLWIRSYRTVYVSFLRSVSGESKGRLRVFVDTLDSSYRTVKEPSEANVCEPALWQLDVDNSYDGGNDGGMSYVIRLTDGTFVVIDGGYRTAAEADNLYSVLYANNPLSGKPVISAWFFTHVHIDHYGILSQFTNMYRDKVEAKGFYYNFPGNTVKDIYPNNAAGIENSMKQWTGAVLYPKLHSGMVMGFAGATVEVLATHEDVRQSYYKKGTFGLSYNLTANDFASGNDTSTVLRFHIAGQSILFLADADAGVSKLLLNNYTAEYLKSDIVQVAHHGFDDGADSDLYTAVGAKTLLWPMDITRYVSGELTVGTTTDTKTFLHYYDNSHGQKTAYNAATDVFPAYQNQMLMLPYTAVGNKPANAAEHYTAVATSQKAVINAAEVIYIQKSLDGSAMRIIGVLKVAEDRLNDFKSFGFELAFQYGGKTYTHTLTTQTVYTSVMADGKQVTAESLGGTFLYAVEITELDGITEDVAFVITAIGTHGETTQAYAVERYAFEKPSEHLAAKEDGSMLHIHFSELLVGAES